MFEWNQPYQLLMEMKRKYQEKVGKIESYNLEEWLEVLDNSYYHEIFEHLHVTTFGHYVLLKYNLISLYASGIGFGDEDSIFRECRSVVINLKEEELVLAPFKKFFNLNEIPENNAESILEKIKTATVFEIMNKLDGSMQSGRYYKGDYFLSGSAALDKEVSWRLQDGYSYLTEDYRNMLKAYPQYTFIFEYIGPKNQHVVLYNEEESGLHVIGIRDVLTGRQLHYYEVQEIVSAFDGVKMVRFESVSFTELLERMKVYQAGEKEGWVVNIDGHFLKIKCDDYVQIHKTIGAISSVNVIIQHIAEDTYDDFISKIPVIHQERVKKIASDIFQYVSEEEKKIQKLFDAAPKEDTKSFMKWTEENCSKELKGYVRNKYLGKPYHPLKLTNRYKKAKEIALPEDDVK